MANRMQGNYGDDSEGSDQEYMRMPDTKQREESVIEGLLKRMGDATDRLESSLDTLHTKLRPVIGPARPELADKESGQDREEMSDIAAAIDDQIDRLFALKRSIDTVTSRVEC